MIIFANTSKSLIIILSFLFFNFFLLTVFPPSYVLIIPRFNVVVKRFSKII